MNSTQISLSIEDALRNEANKNIAYLRSTIPGIQHVIIESVLESLYAVAQELEIPLAKHLHVRLVEMRNDLTVNEVE